MVDVISVKEYNRGRNQLPEIREVMVPVWYERGWVPYGPKPHLFQMLVRSIPPSRKGQQTSYAVDGVDYLSKQPLSDLIPSFEKTIPKLREVLRISLARELDVPLERVKYIKANVLWCRVSVV